MNLPMNPHFPNLPVLGIDVSKLTFDVCLLLTDGSKAIAQFSNHDQGFAKLNVWLEERHATRVLSGLEATGAYGVRLLWHLHTCGHVACQLNPRRIKDYARSQGRRVKTDRTDAALIASYLKTSEVLHAWEPPAQALCELQALVRRRQDLLEALQAERNRRAANASASAIIKASLERQIGLLKAEVTTFNRAIEAHVLAHAPLQKSVRLLRSIDGIGLTVAVTILAEVPALSAFTRARDLAAFAGLTPCLAESGTSVRRRGRMSKEGSALLRKMLYMAALQAVKRSTNAFHQMYRAFVARGKAKKCALGAIMHKLIRVAFGVLKHQTPFVPSLAKI
jgi:transposase